MNEELINKILEGIAKDEGTEGRAVALEGGGSTRGYGITTIAEGLKKALSFSNLNADEMSDKDLARQIVIYNIGEMKKDIGEETWNNLPDQMKIVASDQYYNSGKLFDGFKGDLISGNYENALKNTLDIISANDPKTGTNGVMTGLINRRVSKYNEAAEVLGFNQITNFTTGNSVEEGKQTAVTYNYNNSDPFIVNTISGMHSQSLKKTDKSFLGDRTSILSEAASNALEQVQEFIPEEIKAPITEVVTPIAEAVTPIVDSLELPVEENVGSAPGFSKTLEEAKILNTEREDQELLNESINAKNFIDDIQEPQIWDLDYVKPYDQRDLDALQYKQEKLSKELEGKYSWLEEMGAAINQEWLEAKMFDQGRDIYEQHNSERLQPDINFELTQEKLDELAKDLPDEFRDEFAHAHSDGHALQIRATLLDHLEMEEKIYSDGVFSGTMKRLLASFTDPGAYAAIIATEGLLAPVVVLQKMGRAGRIIKRGLAGAGSFGAIEGYLASQRPDLDIDDVMHGILIGAVLGGVLGIKTPKGKPDAFTKSAQKSLDESDAKLLPPDPKGGPSVLITADNPNPIKPNGERTLAFYDDTFDMALATTKRADGRYEIALNRARSKDDELIMQVNKDGTVEIRKCK